MNLRILVAMAAFFIGFTPALAQWQVPNNTVPIGRGTGTGFKSTTAGTNNQAFMGSTGNAPGFRALTTADLPSPFTNGTINGNTSVFATISGSTSSGHCPQFDASGNLIDSGSACSAAAVLSVSNGDGTLTISPTTGSVVASIALAHPNTWTAAQSFPAAGVLIKGSSTAYTTLSSLNSTGSGNTISLPNVTDTVAVLGTQNQTLSGGANVTTQTLTTGSITVDCGSRPLQQITGSTSAWTITAPANDGSCILKLTNAASGAVIPTFSGFTVGASAGAALTADASAVFYISVWRIGGTAGYQVTAGQ